MEPGGSIATAPAEVDDIVRKAYGKIYKGNVTYIEKATRQYLEDYAEFLFEAPTANITMLTELKAMAVSAKESAAGLDQWAPGDLRLLSDLAFEYLADLLNMIE